MRIHAARGDDLAFPGDDFSSHADRDRDVGLNIRITRFADGEDPGVLMPISAFTIPVIDDQGVGYHQIHTRLRAHLSLTHAVADHFPAAEFDLFAVGGEVFFHLNPQVGIRQTYLIAGGWAKHVGVRLP